jgi:hypothetical protein
MFSCCVSSAAGFVWCRLLRWGFPRRIMARGRLVSWVSKTRLNLQT